MIVNVFNGLFGYGVLVVIVMVGFNNLNIMIVNNMIKNVVGLLIGLW